MFWLMAEDRSSKEVVVNDLGDFAAIDISKQIRLSISDV